MQALFGCCWYDGMIDRRYMLLCYQCRVSVETTTLVRGFGVVMMCYGRPAVHASVFAVSSFFLLKLHHVCAVLVLLVL